MNDSAIQRLRELLWKRNLTESESSELQNLLLAHPDAQAEFELESSLNAALDNLPAAPPVASNFTAQVMLAIERDAKVRTRTDKLWFFHGWLPKFAVAALSLTLVFGLWHQHVQQDRQAMARDVAQLGAALVSASPDLTQNLDPIRRLGDNGS